MIKETALILHVFGGMSGLLLGSLILVIKKGDKRHRYLGLGYVISMALATLSGIGMAFWGNNQFLFLIGIFSFYLCYSGWRMARQKRGTTSKMKIVDLSIAIITLFLSVFMILSGIFDFEQNKWVINPVLIIFGSASLVFSFNDTRLYLRPDGDLIVRKQWLNTHIGRMSGSYISALTAFLVVNLSGLLPPLLVWLGPSLIIGPLISRWVRKYTRPKASIQQ